MRLLKIIVISLLVAVSLLSAYTKVSESIKGDSVAPAISCDTDVLEISVLDDESALLRGITARDAQDGDLTDKIMVAGISKFTGDATVSVTYMVFDSDDNIGSLTRTIHYTDYTSPRIEILQPLVYQATETKVLLDRISVMDCIDGDITSSVRLTSQESTSHEEIYIVGVSVTNSMGDTTEIELPIVWYTDNQERPVVVLKSNLIYLQQGSSFSPRDYLVRAENAEGAVNKSEVKITGGVNTDMTGTYMVQYSYTYEGLEGIAVLTVVVE